MFIFVFLFFSILSAPSPVVENKEPSVSSPPKSLTEPSSEENVTEVPTTTDTEEPSESQPALNLTLRLRYTSISV